MQGRLTTWTLATAPAFAGGAGAQTSVGYGAVVVIPVVAQTSSFATEVFLHNPSSVATPVPVAVTFVEGTTSGTPGVKACTPITVNNGQSASFTLAAQCGIASGGHFGMLILQDDSAEAVHQFFAYSRTQTPQGIGFSVEGFPAGTLTGQSQRSNGLKRMLSASPAYNTNCFVGSFEQPVDYEIDLRAASGAFLGSKTGHLDPHQLVRHLDVFAAAGLVGDFTNVSATTRATNASTPGNRDHPLFVSFCTVQENASLSADFRIGKSFDGWDLTHQQAPGCTVADCGAYDYAVPDATHKQVFQLFVRTPDNLKCELLSDRLGELEMRLRQPVSYGDCDLCGAPPGTSAVPTVPGPVAAGGDNLTSFYYPTPVAVMRASDGQQLRNFWFVEVGAREIAPTPVGPIPFSLSCIAGNGTFYAAPYTAPDDF